MGALVAALQHLDGGAFGILAVFTLALVAGGLAWRGLSPSRDVVVARLRGENATASRASTAGGLGERMAQTLAPVARLAQPTDAQEVSLLRTRLVRAGLRQRYSVQVFLAVKVLLAVALPLVFLAVNTRVLFTDGLTTPVAIWLAIAGFLLPNLFLARGIGHRQRLLERALPDAMDLLVTCVEAGLGLDAALSRVASEIELSSPVLAEELRTLLLELGAGLSRGEAFRRLFERTGLSELRSLSSTLQQADTFGTSVAAALRTQGDWMRTRRMQRAEERAGTISVKMTIPLVLCILPSLISVVMGPAAVRVYRALLPSLGGGP